MGMTDEELIKWLREWHFPETHQAADRIEQLVKEVNETHKEAMACIENWGAALKSQREAEAKLEKAKAVLTSLANMKGEVAMASHAREVLTELEKAE